MLQGLIALSASFAKVHFCCTNFAHYVHLIFCIEAKSYKPEVESRTQGLRPRLRSRTQKNCRPRPKTAFPRTDPLEAKDRNARCQSQGRRALAQVFSEKRSSKKLVRRSQKKEVFKIFFQAICKILNMQKIVLSSNRGQGKFRGFEASSPKPRTLKFVLETKDVFENSTSDINT